ncbi:hypothetical protein BKA56DRAFT_737908, partial [Ilyonectria sp. MPI-CAGE-AT-0026]
MSELAYNCSTIVSTDCRRAQCSCQCRCSVLIYRPGNHGPDGWSLQQWTPGKYRVPVLPDIPATAAPAAPAIRRHVALPPWAPPPASGARRSGRPVSDSSASSIRRGQRRAGSAVEGGLRSEDVQCSIAGTTRPPVPARCQLGVPERARQEYLGIRYMENM